MDNHWVGHSVMKPVDAESIQRKKSTKEVGDGKNYDFNMEILETGSSPRRHTFLHWI